MAPPRWRYNGGARVPPGIARGGSGADRSVRSCRAWRSSKHLMWAAGARRSKERGGMALDESSLRRVIHTSRVLQTERFGLSWEGRGGRRSGSPFQFRCLCRWPASVGVHRRGTRPGVPPPVLGDLAEPTLRRWICWIPTATGALSGNPNARLTRYWFGSRIRWQPPVGRVGREVDATPFMVWLVAYRAWLQWITGEVVFGTGCWVVLRDCRSGSAGGVVHQHRFPCDSGSAQPASETIVADTPAARCDVGIDRARASAPLAWRSAAGQWRRPAPLFSRGRSTTAFVSVRRSGGFGGSV